MEKCIFCKIAKGEMPCKKIYEDKDFIAFLDIKPVGIGHTLIIPKKHFETILDLDNKISKRYLDFAINTAKILMKKHSTSGFNLVLNNGKSAGQAVGHVHFHLLPRRSGDNQRGIFIG